MQVQLIDTKMNKVNNKRKKEKNSRIIISSQVNCLEENAKEQSEQGVQVLKKPNRQNKRKQEISSQAKQSKGLTEIPKQDNQEKNLQELKQNLVFGQGDEPNYQNRESLLQRLKINDKRIKQSLKFQMPQKESIVPSSLQRDQPQSLQKIKQQGLSEVKTFINSNLRYNKFCKSPTQQNKNQ